MANTSSCPTCGKEFSRKFNMEKHMKTCPKRNSKIIKSFNKLEEFDKLKKDVLNMKSKFEILQERYKDKQKMLKSRVYENHGNNHRIESRINGKSKSDRTKYIFFENDRSLPVGWKSGKFRNKSSIGINRKVKNLKVPKLYFSPNGKMCRSRRFAIHYMITRLNSSEEDINIMVKGLIQDGWKKMDIIEGWYWNTQLDKKIFISKDFLYQNGIKEAVKYLSIFGSERDLFAFLKEYVKPNAITLEEIFDKKIPFPWRVIATDTNKGKCFIFIAPDGTTNTSIGGVLSAINKSQFASEAIRETFIEYLQHLKNNISQKVSSSVDTSLTPDESLPEGWTIGKTSQSKTLIKNPDGAIFMDRKEACVFLIKNKYSPADIFKLWSTLHLDGWIDDKENLPTGWKKKYISESQSHHFLSPLMDEVQNKEDLSTFIKSNISEYKDYDISKIKFL